MRLDHNFITPIFSWDNVLSEKDFKITYDSVIEDKKHIDIPVLKQFILNTAVKDIVNTLGINYKYIVEITEMWGNVLYQGDDHGHHNHPNNIFSGIFYLTDGNPTSFIDPRPASNVFQIDQPTNSFNSTEVHYGAIPNVMLIFDSWLRHYVTVNKTPNVRKTISFNILLRGQYGKENSLANVRI